MIHGYYREIYHCSTVYSCAVEKLLDEITIRRKALIFIYISLMWTTKIRWSFYYYAILFFEAMRIVVVEMFLSFFCLLMNDVTCWVIIWTIKSILLFFVTANSINHRVIMRIQSAQYELSKTVIILLSKFQKLLFVLIFIKYKNVKTAADK